MCAEMYSEVIQNLAGKALPFRTLINPNFAWLWKEDQTRALEQIKKALKEVPTLDYHDTNGNMTHSVDDSSNALRAAL